ncbi:MAG: peptidoglycan-binding protein [Lachnospiraceae bacterium]|nr:peptidoglycan-binding protein [Lachnospiraceae bacterium]
MNEQNLKVLTNIIGAVESGGQVYGKRRYNAYDSPYKNSPKEHTITIGWAQCYGHEARQLMKEIFTADAAAFRKLDTAGIEGMLSKDWVSLKWNPSAKQKSAIIAIIDSPIGHTVQDRMFEEKMKSLIADCARDYTNDVKSQMMYCEIRHLGGKGPVDRIYKRAKGYSTDDILASLILDQKDKSSSNQVGDTIYWSRHIKCKQFIDQYAMDEEEMKSEEKSKGIDPQKVIDIADAEVGYHEKKTGDLKYLYDKTANSGSNNYTKYNFEMHKLQPSNMDYPAAWCDCFNDWCFKEAFGVEAAKKILCGGFEDYTPSSAQKYKDKGRWGSEARVGAQIFFKNTERICHTGIVYKVTDKYVYTIEGNCDNEVRKRSYLKTNSKIAGYGYPLYDSEDPKPETKGNVAEYQKFLNTYYPTQTKKAVGELLVVDNEYGSKTRAASVSVWKYMANKYYDAELTIGNAYFLAYCKKIAGEMTLASIESHPTLKKILQGLLAGRGYYKGAIDGIIGKETITAITDMQLASNLLASGTLTASTWYKLFN